MDRKMINEIKERRIKEIEIRHQKQKNIKLDEGLIEDGKIHVMICAGTGCHSSSSDEIRVELIKEVKKRKLQDKVVINRTGCFGLCETGPNIVIFPQGIFYTHVQLSDIEEIVKEHFINGNIVKRLVYANSTTDGDYITPVDQVSFYKFQVRRALENCGRIDPESLEDYIAYDGYQALLKTLFDISKDEAIKILIDSNLRGRGGAGFSTGLKWSLTQKEKGEKKYIVCNGDEGDPGAFMDRSILEGDPFCIIEAMTIAAYVIGSDEGFAYIRAEYPIAVSRFQKAIDLAKENNLLGKNILGTDFSFDLHIRQGAGAFVCGEETALIESIEGKRGTPRNKPPFPANAGVYGKPTLINNVETFANIAPIIRNGADWFKLIGTKDSPGTKVFSLGGKINNTGLIEVPMGMTFREIIYNVGGGIPNNRDFKAVQTGGPSGGCIPKKFLDAPIEFESLKKLGSMMGSGGMIVLDDSNCMVDIAKFYLEFIVDESCGKCTPCRVGTKRLLEMITSITQGKATMEDLDKVHELAVTIRDTSACGLGQTAPNPVLSTLQYFKDEYVEHIKDKKCRAGVCKELIEYIINDKCIGCTKCKRTCPVLCIKGEIKKQHEIDQEKCIKCGSCYQACPIHAIEIR